MALVALVLPDNRRIVFDNELLSVVTRGAAVLQMPSGNYAASNGSDPAPRGPLANGPNMSLIHLAIAGPKDARASVRLVSKDGFEFEPELNAHLDSFFDCFGSWGELFKLLHEITELMDGLSASAIEFRNANGQWIRQDCDLSPARMFDAFARHWSRRRGGRAGGMSETQRATAAPSSLYGLNLH